MRVLSAGAKGREGRGEEGGSAVLRGREAIGASFFSLSLFKKRVRMTFSSGGGTSDLL